MLPAEKKDTIFCALRKFFGPSYFVTALVPTLPLPQEAYVSLRCKKMEVFMDQKKLLNGFLGKKSKAFVKHP